MLYKAALASGYDPEDIEQSAWVGACRASQLYNPSRAAFATYALLHARASVQLLVRRVGPRRDEMMSLDYELHVDHSPVRFSTLIATKNDGGCHPDDLDELEHALLAVDDRSREVVRMRYAGKRLEVVAERLGVTRARVQQIEEAAMGKLRRQAQKARSA